MVFLPDHGGVEVDPEENVYNEDTDGSLGESGDAIVRAAFHLQPEIEPYHQENA